MPKLARFPSITRCTLDPEKNQFCHAIKRGKSKKRVMGIEPTTITLAT